MWSRIASLFPRNRRSPVSKTAEESAPLPPSDESGGPPENVHTSLIAPPDTQIDRNATPYEANEARNDHEHETESKIAADEYTVPSFQQPGDRNDAEDTDELSARWAAARQRPLVYAHRLRLNRDEFDHGAQTVLPASSSGEEYQVPREAATNAFPKDETLRREATAAAAALTAESNASLLSEEHDTSPALSLQEPTRIAGQFRVPASVPPEPIQVAEHSHDLQGLSTDAPTRATERFSLLRVVAKQWRVEFAPCDYLFVVGSAAEGRKMAPVIRALRGRAGFEHVLVCVAGDHPNRTRESLSLVGINVDVELSTPTHQESLEEVRTRMITGFGKILTEVKPQWVVVQGDGTTAAMASIAAYYTQIQVAHIEGGPTWRNVHEGDESNPEVLHHLIANLFASVHFAETSWSKDALIREGVPEQSILVTGNTGVDVTHETCAALGLPIGAKAVRSSGVVRVLVIVEQPDTVAQKLPNLCHAIRNLAKSVPGLYQFAWPLQADSQESHVVYELLDRVPGVLLSGPANYEQFLRQLSDCDLVLTDVEDVQEEAPSFGKPVLLLGQTTQRPEASRAGITTLIGLDAASIQAGVRTLARKLSVRHGSITNPYGDGKAALRVLDFFEGRQVLEFGRSALPRLSATGDSTSMRRLGTSSTAN